MRILRFTLALSLFSTGLAFAQTMQGKVVMADGTPPGQRVIIERVCNGALIQDALTGKKGEFFWQVPGEATAATHRSRRMGSAQIPLECVLRARLNDMESEPINFRDPKILRNLQLPTLVLRRAAPLPAGLPPAAAHSWDLAVKAFQAEKWAEAERMAEDAVRRAPTFAPAWDALGLARQQQKRVAPAREAFLRAVAADPAALLFRLHLARAELTLQLWPEAARSAQAVIEADSEHRNPEAYLVHGMALRMTRDFELARASLQTYVERAPNSRGVALAKTYLDELSRPAPPSEPSAALAETLLAPALESGFDVAREASIPGGRKALAAIAGLNPVPDPRDFFLQYCRAIAAQTSGKLARPTPGYIASLHAYLSVVSELQDLGEQKDDRTTFTLSLRDGKTPRILALLGWKVAAAGGAPAIEPGDQAQDDTRRRVLTALGIDDAAMQAALDAGGTFHFEIVSEAATLTGGISWNSPLQPLPPLSAGISEAFVRDLRLARTYAGLASMPAPIASLLVKRMGLNALVSAHSEGLWQSGAAFSPPESEFTAVWAKLVGTSPATPDRFFEALLKDDRGRMAAFYAAISRLDAARRKFYLKDSARAQRLYSWYRSDEASHGALLAELPLDENGDLRFPGGRQAWAPASAGPDGGEFLWSPSSGAVASHTVESLVAIAKLERERAAPFDTESARLLAAHFGEWRPLAPYFSAMPRLGAAEFSSLDTFHAAARAHAAPETLMREWHSLIALISLARQAGALDDDAAARAFGRACQDLLAKDHSAMTLAIVRDLVGRSADLDDAVVSGLLRRNGAQRVSFDRVRRLQSAPRLQSAADIGLALSAIVYAATLDPDGLLVNEDPGLLRRHTFVQPGALFSPSALERSNTSKGSRFTGGFMNFDAVARGLVGAGRVAPPFAEADSSESGATFRASARLVEAYATVTDRRGRLIDGLRADQFVILDGGRSMRIAAFENDTGAISCALLLDTSLSMDKALPALKSAALKLIAGLRPDDAVAVYTLNQGVSEILPFTRDKAAAARAVQHVELGELTSLYDGLVRVNRDLSPRKGKKAMVVFTDGEDNDSTLSAEIAVLRARTSGVPIYTIAQGHALGSIPLLDVLGRISTATGGLTFRIQTPAEIAAVFEKVLQDLLHGYLLAFQPPEAKDRNWRKIEVVSHTQGSVRHRQGYYPD